MTTPASRPAAGPVLVALTHGVDEVQVVVLVDALRRAGLRVATASVGATNPLVGRGRFRIMADVDIADALTEWGDCAAAVVLPAGRAAAAVFRSHPGLMALAGTTPVVGLGDSAALVPGAPLGTAWIDDGDATSVATAGLGDEPIASGRSAALAERVAARLAARTPPTHT